MSSRLARRPLDCEDLCAKRTGTMIEPLLCGIVLGLIPVTLLGLFVAAWNQYRRGSALGG